MYYNVYLLRLGPRTYDSQNLVSQRGRSYQGCSSNTQNLISHTQETKACLPCQASSSRPPPPPRQGGGYRFWKVGARIRVLTAALTGCPRGFSVGILDAVSTNRLIYLRARAWVANSPFLKPINKRPRKRGADHGNPSFDAGDECYGRACAVPGHTHHSAARPRGEHNTKGVCRERTYFCPMSM